MVNISTILNRHNIVSLTALLVPVLLAWPALGAAEDTRQLQVTSTDYRVPVVELYTSEGCSSCPRADEWISKLGDYINPELDAIPLAFHVDYWNYLGWEDPFSQAKFTERQRFLGSINKQRSIYTPEFLVSGEETRGTSKVLDAIVAANDESASVAISMMLEPSQDGNLSAMLTIDNQTSEGTLFLAVYENDIVREIGAGENHGRTLHHDFVVRHWSNVAILKSGRYEKTHKIPIGEGWNRDNLGLAVIVVDPRTSETLQAVRTDLASLLKG